MALNSNNKNFQEPSDGTQNWGAILNSNFSIVDSAFGNSSTVTLSNGANVTLTTAQFQSARIVLSGTVTTTATVTIPSDIGGGSTSGSYWLFSNGTGGTITVTTGGANNVVINPVPTGSSAPYRNVYIFSDGSNIYSLDQASSLAVNEGGTGLSTLTGANNALYSTSASALTAGTLPYLAGGTGISTTPTNGQIDIGNGTGFTRTTITAGNGVTVTNGAGSITLSSAGSVVNSQIFSSSGTWTVPSGVQANDLVMVELWGGGGGGGAWGSSGTNGAGGGGGAFYQGWFLASQIGSSQSITVGSGGAGGFASNAATAGGNSSFGSLITVTGGNAGISSSTGGAYGGGGGSLSGYAVSPWTGPAAIQGNGGNSGYGGAGGGGVNSSNNGGTGGYSIWGGGGGGAYGSSNLGQSGGVSLQGGAGGAGASPTGTAGTAPAGGGGGGTTTGGAGARGEVRVFVIRQTTA
jgi:hypothetical protein